MTRTVIYTRFSPRRNADESESCETQKAYCEKYAEENGLTVADAFHDEDVSGKDEYREKLWQAISAVTKGGVLLVYKRDRLARNVYLSEQINRAVEKKGGRIEAVSGDVRGDGPEHVMIRQVLASIAEYERKLIALRTKHAMLHHQKSGRLMSRFPPYGWKMDPVDKARMIEDPAEQSAIAEIRVMCGEGRNPNEIARMLNEDGVFEPRGSKWSTKTVTKILGRM